MVDGIHRRCGHYWGKLDQVLCYSTGENTRELLQGMQRKCVCCSISGFLAGVAYPLAKYLIYFVIASNADLSLMLFHLKSIFHFTYQPPSRSPSPVSYPLPTLSTPQSHSLKSLKSGTPRWGRTKHLHPVSSLINIYPYRGIGSKKLVHAPGRGCCHWQAPPIRPSHITVTYIQRV